MTLRLITPPASNPVSLDEVRAFLRLTDTSQDGLITGLLATAVLDVQSDVQRYYVTQTAEWVIDRWQACLRIPIAPVAADGIVSIKYVDTNNVQQTLDPSLYVVRTSGPTVNIEPVIGTIWPILSIKPASEPIIIRFEAGTDAKDVPE